MFNLPNGSKEQIIAEWLHPELEPDLEDPVYKGLEFLLTTYLPDGKYHVYDPEAHHTNQEANDFVHENSKVCGSDHNSVELGRVAHGDVTHSIYKRADCKGVEVFTLSYNNCSLMGGLPVYFIKEQ